MADQQYRTETRTDGNGQSYDVRIPLNSNVISSASMAPMPPLQIAPASIDTMDYSSITGGITDSLINDYKTFNQQLVDKQKAQETAGTDITKMMESLTGKTADTAVANETAGVNSETDKLNKYVQELADLNAQASSLNREAQAIPLQTQERNANTGVTDRGVAPQNASALRLNAIKTLSIGQQSDIAAAAATGSNLRLQAAKDKAQQIVDLKYKPLEDALAIKEKQYELNKDVLMSIDKKRTEALTLAIDKEKTALADAKAKEKSIQDIALEVAKNGVTDANVFSAISGAKTIDEAIRLAAPSLQKVNTDIIKLDNGATLLIDKSTGKVIKNFGGIKPTSDTTPTVPVGTSEQIGGLASIGNLVGGFSSVNAQKMFTKNISDLVKKGDEKGLAEKIVGQTLANIPDGDMRKKTTGGFLLAQQLTVLQKLLNDYEAKGGNTNIIKGKTQDIQQKLGLLGDKDLANIGTQILNQLDNLARTRTGAVISPSEEKLYARLLPSIGKVKELNEANITGLKTSLMTDVENNLRYNLTTDGLNVLKSTLPEVFDYNDAFLNSFSSENINKNLDNSSFFKSLPY